MCTSARRYLALTASVKVRIDSPKTARMNKFVLTKIHTGSNFPKHLRGYYARDGLQLFTYIAVFLFGVRWHLSKPPNFRRIFWSIFYQFEEG